MVQRLTISLDDDIAEAVDGFMAKRGYTNRSEAIRDLLRDAMTAAASPAIETRACVAAVSYVYDHHHRDLARRLAEIQHAHHDLVTAVTHTHLDHEHCLEVVMLQGQTAAVRRFAEALTAERGVAFGQVNLIPMAEDGEAHRHGAGEPRHIHTRPAL